MSKEKQSKKDFDEYQRITKQKFDLEDKITTIRHNVWEERNEVLQTLRQLRLVEDQLRIFFNRERLEFKEDKESS